MILEVAQAVAHAAAALGAALGESLRGAGLGSHWTRSGASIRPWWWSALLGLAWAPLLWLSIKPAGAMLREALAGILMIAGMTGAALLAHALPLGLVDKPQHTLGVVALAGMGVLYLSLALLHLRPRAIDAWRRWSYAGFYVDEYYTRLALWLWPTRWTPESSLTSPASR